MALMLVLAGLSPLYVELQYTKTAAIVTAAGYVLVFCAGRTAGWKICGGKETAEISDHGGRHFLPAFGKLDSIPGFWHGEHSGFLAFGLLFY